MSVAVFTAGGVCDAAPQTLGADGPLGVQCPVMARKRRTLFDPAEARGPKDTPDVGSGALKGAEGPAAMSVSALVARIKNALTEAFPQRVCVVGEVSNLSAPSSGHLYFSLKDAGASIAAAMWRSQAEKLKFRPTDGLEVVVEGRVDVYDTQGKLQLYVERITPRGAGALELAFRQLKEKLQAEGLFDPAHKKPLVRFPRAIGVITSATGAAVRDIQRTIHRRWPGLNVYLLPTTVQGDEAAGRIAEAVALLDAAAEGLDIDTIIVARGGGSLEDLWAFNEEVVARAVFAARTPIISGVGHEVDVTICDLAADVRAPTPTGAAELAVPDRREVVRHVAQLHRRLSRTTAEGLAAARQALRGLLRSGVFRDPLGRVRGYMQRMDELSSRLRAALHGGLARAGRRLEPATQRLAMVHPIHRLRLARQRVASAGRQLEAMSYRGVLRRGFSVTRSAEGAVLRSAADVRAGQRVTTVLSDGAFDSEVVEGGPRKKITAQMPVPRKPKSRQGPTLFD
jgi:exodeoxyribonuclease VII large subunit